jgi:hypothetical protein
MNKILLILVILLFTLPFSDAYPCVNYSFLNNITKTSINNVNWQVYKCTDTTCSNVDKAIWFQSGDSGSKSYAEIKFLPSAPPDHYYLINFFHEDFIYQQRVTAKNWPEKTDPNKCDTYSVWQTEKLSNGETASIIRFYRKSLCKSSSSVSLTNEIGEWLPLTIQTDSVLDAETQSAFRPATNTYYPPEPEYRQYMEATTDLIVTIKDIKSPATPIFTQSEHLSIYSGSSVASSILWDTTSSYPGNFSVNVTTHITTPKCSSVIDTSIAQNVQVFPELPDGQCYTLVQNFAYVPTATSVLSGEKINFTGRKITNFGEYRYVDPDNGDYTETYYVESVPSKAYLTFRDKLTGSIVGQFTYSLGTNPDPRVYQNFVFRWQTEQTGLFTVTIDMKGEEGHWRCTEGNIPATQTIDSISVGVIQVVDPDNDGDGYNASADCNDANANVNPGMTEVCWDSLNNDCNTATPDDCGMECRPTTSRLCSVEKKGICSIGTERCSSAGVWTGCPLPQTEDCQDAQLLDEDCDGYANCLDTGDCAGLIRDFRFVCTNTCMAGYYDANLDPNDGCECFRTADGLETCDGMDNDCDGSIDEMTSAELPLCSSLPGGTSLPNVGICKDLKAVCDFAGHGGFYCQDIRTAEKCDGLDNNCNNQTDEGCDDDLDGYPDASMICLTASPSNWTCSKLDCNDNSSIVNPGAAEICDGLDNNCNAEDDDLGCTCRLGDSICSQVGVCGDKVQTCGNDGKVTCVYTDITGYEVSETLCDGKDNDCDGLIDVQDGLASCCSLGQVRGCSVECEGDIQVEGQQKCSSFQWADCDATCPEIPVILAVKILSPENEKTYFTSEDYKEIPVKISGQGNQYCQFKLEGKQFIGISDDSVVRAGIGENSLTVRCGSTNVISKLYVQREDFSPADQDMESAIDELEDEGISAEELKRAEKSEEFITSEVGYTYQGDDTIIKHTINPMKGSQDGKLYMKIPKCLAEHIDDIEFDFEGYEVINEDPVMVWHFKGLSDVKELTYRVKGKIPQDCLDQIRSLPIADLIKSEKSNPFSVLFAVAFVIIIVSGYLYFNMKKPSAAGPRKIDPAKNPIGNKKPDAVADAFMESIVQQYQKELKANKISTKQAAAQYLLSKRTLSKPSIERILNETFK